MNKKFAVPIFALIIIALIISLSLLIKKDFFTDYNVENFNNIVTPVATTLAFLIYFATLLEIQISNKKIINFQRLDLFKKRIERMRGKLENHRILIPYSIEEKLNLPDNFNLSNFFFAYTAIHKDMRDEIERGNSNLFEHSMFFHKICYDLKLYFGYIKILIQEIQDSNFEKIEKKSLSESIKEILANYFYIISIYKDKTMVIKYTDSLNNKIELNGYDAPYYKLPFNKQTTVFEDLKFDEIYNLMEQYKML